MYTEESYDDYLHRLNVLSLFAIAMDVEDDGLERCAMCGDRHEPETFGTHSNQRMCQACIELEKENDLLRVLAMIDDEQVEKQLSKVRPLIHSAGEQGNIHRPCG